MDNKCWQGLQTVRPPAISVPWLLKCCWSWMNTPSWYEMCSLLQQTEPHRGISVSWWCSSLHLSLLFYCSNTYREASISKMARNSNERLLQTEKSWLQWTIFSEYFLSSKGNFFALNFFFPEMWCSQPFCLLFEFLDKEAIWKGVILKYDSE